MSDVESRGSRRWLGAGFATLAVATAVLFGIGSPAHADPGTISVSPSTGVGDSDVVTVSGSGFTSAAAAGASLRVALCDAESFPTLILCDVPLSATVEVEPNGTFSVELDVRNLFTGTHPIPPFPSQEVSCLGSDDDDVQCAVFTSRVGNGALDIASANLTFAS